MASENSQDLAYNVLTSSMYSSAEFEHELLSGRDDLLRHELCNPEALLQAVVFVEDAVKFRSIYHKVDIKSLWYYRLYYSPIVQWFISTAICVILLLAFFEYPSSITTGWSSDPRTRGERREAPCGLTEGIELVCLLVFVADVSMKAYLIGQKQFIKQKWLSAYVLVIVASIIDWTISVNMSCNETIRFRRLLRPFFLLQNSSLMKKTVRSIKRTLPEVFSVIMLVVLHLYFFTMVGLIIFSTQDTHTKENNSTESNTSNGTSEGFKFFHSIGSAYMSLLVLLTTANNPDVMMPAYKANRMNVLFFIIFITIGLYCFFNMLTAVIYNQFRGYLQSSMQASFFRRRLGIRAAFEIMRQQGKVTNISGHIRNTVPVSLVKSVILQVKMKRIFKTAIIRELDDRMGGFLTSTDFRSLFDVLDRHIKVQKTFPERNFRNPILRKVQSCISHKYFAYFGSFVAVVNVFCITLEMSLSKKQKEKEDLLAALNFIFIIYYILELILKVWMIGWRKYFSSKLNIVDLVIVASLFVVEIAYASSVGTPFYSTDNDNHVLFVLSRVINLLILVRLFRMVTHIKPMAIVVYTTLDLIRNLRAFAGILVVIYYFFAILGIQLFNDKITFDGRKVERLNECGTYEQLNYWANNFDDFAAALVVLWDVMLVNNWHIFLNAYSVYVSKWAQIYFIVWYFVSVLVCLNLFAALIIENFITKWDRYHLQQREEQTMYMLNVHAMFRPDLKEPSEDELLNALHIHHHLTM